MEWLLRQLPEGDPRLRLNAFYASTRETGSALLGEVEEQPQRLLSSSDAKREIKAFEVALTRVLGQKNGRGAGSFIEETRSQLLDFYGEVVQNLTPWVARAPRLAATDEAATPDLGDDAAVAGVVDPEELEGVASTSSGMVAGGSYKSAVPLSEGPPPEPEPPQNQ